MPRISDEPYWHVTLKCPKCEAKGMVPWNRLKADKRLYCKRCTRWYRLTGQGALIPATAPEKKIQVSVRSAFSNWIEYQRNEIFGRYSMTDTRFWRDLCRTIFGWLCAGGKGTKTAVAVTALGGLLLDGWLTLRSDAVQAASKEPVTIAERAPIFATAWATRHFGTMMRYTFSDQLEPLKKWTSATALPPYFADLEFNEIVAEVVSITPQKDPQLSLVKVRIMPRASEGVAAVSNYAEHVEYWRESEGKWLFSAKESEAALPAATIVPSSFRR